MDQELYRFYFISGYDAIGSNRVLETRRWEFESLYPDKMQMSHSDLLRLTSNQDFVGLNPTICTNLNTQHV